MNALRRWFRRSRFFRAYKSLSHYPDYWYWKLRINPVRSPHLLKQRTAREYGARYKLKILVETGTYYGEMVAAMKKHFEKIYSIECDPDLAREATRKFERDSRIHILEGDSARVLPELLKSLAEPALFWLDAGYWGWENLRRDPQRLSIEVESILANAVKGHVILLDDARCLNGENGALSLAEFESRVRARFPGHAFEVKHDIFRITPRI